MNDNCGGPAKEVKRFRTDTALHIYYRCQKCGLSFDVITPPEKEVNVWEQ